MQKKVEALPKALIGNTMGDGFLVFGDCNGYSCDIQQVCSLLRQMWAIKQDGDLAISQLRDEIVTDIKKNIENFSHSLPELKLKLTVNLGFVTTIFAKDKQLPEKEPLEQRFVGDAINYCARVGSAAFRNGDDKKLILTHHFFSMIPKEVQELISPGKTSIKVQGYPSKKSNLYFYIYPLAVDDVQFWRKLKNWRDPYMNINKINN